MASILVDNLSFGYTEDKVLDELSLIIEKGEMVVITGGNGSGKSTFMRLILGELTPQSGAIRLMGKKIKELKSFEDIGYVPQGNVISQIAFPLTCLELVVLNLYKDFGFLKIPKKRHKEKAKEMLCEMDLEKYINVPFNELSGGLQQRVLICRAMINNPEILILDEPTAGVDEESKLSFFKIIQDLNTDRNVTVILVTHEIDSTRQNLDLDRIYKLNSGQLSERRAKKCWNLTS